MNSVLLFVKTFIFILFVSIGNAQVTAPPNVTISCGGSTTLAATTSAITYSVSATSCAPVPITGTTAFPTACDDCVTGNIPIGFPFNFYGNVYTDCQIQSNGIVGFGGLTYTGYNVFTIPSTGDPNNYIAGLYGDLDIRCGGTITYALTGTSPNRRFVISYQNIKPYGGGHPTCSGTGSASFQIILNENGSFNTVVSTLTADWNSSITNKLLTQGAENNDGTYAFPVPGRNSTDWTGITPAQQDCRLFNPLPFTFQRWEVNGVTVSTNPNYTVSPTTTTTYTGVWTSSGTTYTATTTVTVVGTSLNLASSINSTLCAGPTGNGSITINTVNFNPGTYTLNYLQNGVASSSTVVIPASTIIPQSTTFNSGSLTTADPTFIRSSSGTTYSATSTVSYDTYTFSPTTSGIYEFNNTFPGDAFAHLYTYPFVSSTPAINFIIADDDGNGNSDPRITATLVAGQTYVLVTTTFSTGVYGAYSWTYTGPTGAAIAATSGPLTTTIPSLPGGSYTNFTMGSGCSAAILNGPIVLTSPATNSATISSASTNLCHGQSTTLSGNVTATGAWTMTLSGSAGTVTGTGSGAWSKIITPTATTNYTISSLTNTTCPSVLTGNTNVTMPILGTTLGNNTDQATCVVNQNSYVHFYHSSGRLLASVNSNGQNLGNVSVTSYVDATHPNVPACLDPTNPNYITATMKRHWVITPQFQPTSPVSVRLPFDNGEFTTLQTIANGNGNPNDNLGAIANVKLSKYSGPNNVNNLFADNCTNYPVTPGNGGTTLHTQTATGNITTYSAGFSASGRYTDFTIPSFSEFWLHGSTGSPLPVALTNFSANCENGATIRWTTASEQNSIQFIVEKSRDMESWTAVGTLAAAGNSNVSLNYQLVDENPWNGITYYRLIQLDNNGDQKTYGPISSSCNSGNNSMTVYPNPSQGNFTVEIAALENITDGRIQLIDLTGKIILNQLTSIEEGINQIYFNNVDLQMGSYVVKFIGGNNTIKPVKLVIQ